MKRSTLLLLVVLVAALAAIAYAQMQPGSGQPPMGPPRMGMMPPVAPVMLMEGNALFILRGDQLIRVNATSLETKVLMLPRPEPPTPPNAP